MGVIGIQEQLELFAGLTYIAASNRVRLRDGALVDQKRFNVIFGGQYEVGDINGRTVKAWYAFTQNMKYRAPVS